MFNSKYYERSLKRIIEEAGASYQQDTNIELPIIEHFDFFTRSPNFYIKIRTIYGDLKRSFDYFKMVKQVSFSKYNDYNFQKNLLLKRLRKIFYYNAEKIEWNLISIHIRFIKDYLSQYENQLRKYKDNKTKEAINEDIEGILENIREINRYLQKVYSISDGINGRLTNNSLFLISGDAGNGKTHLLVDIYKKRISEETKRLTIFTFGEQFTNDKTVWAQIFNSSKLNYSNQSSFLSDFSKYSYKTNTNGLIIIDALNESAPNCWKSNLLSLVEDIKQYPNLNLVISIRNGYHNEIFDANLRKQFVEIEHLGYPSEMLWAITEKYFGYHNIKYQDFPLFTLEFQNPLFLYLFCTANENSRLDDELRRPNGNWLKSLFESYVLTQGYKKVLLKLNSNEKERYDGGYRVLWDDIIKKGIAPWMIDNNKTSIPESELIKIIKIYLPNYDAQRTIKLLENGNILNSFLFSEEKIFTFPFDKFSNHIIIRTLLENIIPADKSKAFNQGELLYNYVVTHKHNPGIMEALCIQIPDFFKKELFELMPSIKDERYFLEPFKQSIIWRNPNNVVNIKEIVKKNLEGKNTFFMEPILNLTHIKSHPLNAEFLDSVLMKQNMTERDSWWSIYLHQNYYGEGDIINRLISWSQDKHEKISSDAIKLTSLTLSWFLSSSNRYIRDKSTKGLIHLLTNNLDILRELLAHFKDIDDDYILERLYCVAYGCCLLNQSDKENINELAIQTYNYFFKDNSPYPHILLRDYARGIIEVALNNGIKLDIDKDNIIPPYNSNMPKSYPSNKDIQKYIYDYESKDFKDYYWAQNEIISSLQPEHTTLQGNMYGDFGRYTFQSALSNWEINEKGVDMQDLSNWAVDIIMNKLKYDVNLFGEFDRDLKKQNYNRGESKIERIGKKYQWIAFHRISAIVSDNCKFKPYFSEDKVYLGAWNPHFRDIDPTLLISSIKTQNKPKFNNLKKIKTAYNIMGLEFKEWINSSEDIPDLFKLLAFKDDSNKDWINFGGSYTWDEETLPEEKKYSLPKRSLRIWFDSYLFNKKESKNLYDSISNRAFWGNWMPNGMSSYKYFLGEYPNSLACKDTIKNYNSWTDKCSYGDEVLPIKILPTTLNYSPSSSNDCSLKDSISIRIPNEIIINENNLMHNFTGQYFKEKELFCFENSILETGFPNGLIVDNSILIKYLKEKGYSLFWKILVEKIVIGDDRREIKYKPKEISIIIELTDDGKMKLISKHEN